MNITLREKKYAPKRNDFTNSAPYDHQYGFWGVVTEVHPEDCTVHVRTNLGFEISGVRVASLEWVTVEEGKHLTGERKLPPIDTYVYCAMPNGEYSSAFVLCSGFARHQAIHADFKKEGEDGAKVQERVDNSGWHYTSDYRTGTKTIQNKVDSPTVSVEVNQESEGDENVTVTVHGSTISITKDNGITIKTDKNINLEQDGDVVFATKGNTEIAADGSITIQSTKTETLEIGNSIATLGAMMSELLDILAQLQTYGSPASHSVSPSTILQLNTLKQKWEQVFK